MYVYIFTIHLFGVVIFFFERIDIRREIPVQTFFGGALWLKKPTLKDSGHVKFCMPRLAKCSVSLWTMVSMKLLWGKCSILPPGVPTIQKSRKQVNHWSFFKLMCIYRTNLQLAVCTQMFSAILFHTFHSNLHYTHGTFMKSMFFLLFFLMKKKQNKTKTQIHAKMLAGNWPTTWRTSVLWLLWP